MAEMGHGDFFWEGKRMVTLVLGGARSGKSSFALAEAARLDGRKAFIAPAVSCDREMEERIAKHRNERSPLFTTFEEPYGLAGLLEKIKGDYPVVLIDCLTVWLGNLLVRGDDPVRETEPFLSVIEETESRLFIVANEVGLGIVPDNPLGRRFRDLAGSLNRAVADRADRVYLVAAGIPLKIK